MHDIFMHILFDLVIRPTMEVKLVVNACPFDSITIVLQSCLCY